ncbi:glycoside hydrolase family 53 protein [Jiulongibacter sp. NS-SX5]|uniref:glycoside hydrolase family 53 protein n=1 Tax=Jiulongibacter sp. NS-SX5 TaxID=3463854 RepID=UPI004059C48F
MPKSFNLYLIILTVLLGVSCETPEQKKVNPYLLGADLSYVNELEDCGGQFYKDLKPHDAYTLFADEGSNLVRLRLWHSPDWTDYSTLKDVKKSIKRAKANQMAVLLDFHYTDSWADPAHQIIPAAWAHITDTKVLGDSLYNYTFKVLEELHKENLTPEYVQVGNEINTEILMQKPSAENGPTNWERNAALLDRGLQAVADFNQSKEQNIQRVLHVAQPENAKEWFANASSQNLKDFEWIGLSYYPNWSEYDLKELAETVAFLKNTYGKEIMIVETGYPYTFQNFDEANNVLGEGKGLDGYPASKEGQMSFMIDLTTTVINAGGKGVVYWEPAWISTPCKTQWGTGSHWENAAFFDAKNSNEALPVFDFFSHDYRNSTNGLKHE